MHCKKSDGEKGHKKRKRRIKKKRSNKKTAKNNKKKAVMRLLKRARQAHEAVQNAHFSEEEEVDDGVVAEKFIPDPVLEGMDFEKLDDIQDMEELPDSRWVILVVYLSLVCNLIFF